MSAYQNGLRISRRRMFGYAGAIVAGPVVASAIDVKASASPISGDRNVLSDPRYQSGAQLMTIVPSTTPVESLGFGTTASATPQWQVAEWWAVNSLANTSPKTYQPGSVPGLSFPGVGYESADHRFIRGYNGEFWMSYDTRSFYSAGPRINGQQWPELHLSQYWTLPNVASKPLPIVNLSRLILDFHVRVPYIINYMGSDFDPDLHTAQAWIYITFQNLTSDSSDFGKSLWFGIPIVDYRYDIPPAFEAVDDGHPGSTGQVIEDLAGTDFWSTTLKDGRWHHTKRDLVPLMVDVFTSAQSIGFLPASTLSDMNVASFDVSWEFPGTFGAAMEFRSIELNASLA